MKLGHRHKHEAVAVDNRGGTLLAPVPRLTVVLWRCACNDVRSAELAGRWTLAQVRGEPEPEPVKPFPVLAAPSDVKENR
jgi:hypothetical protein